MIRFLASFGVLCILTAQCLGEDDPYKWRYTTETLKPNPRIILSDGARTAVIDFSGPAVTFSGNLPVDESAKLFFEYVMKAHSEWCAAPSTSK